MILVVVALSVTADARPERKKKPEVPVPAPVAAAPAPAPAPAPPELVETPCTFAVGDEVTLTVATTYQPGSLPAAVTNRVPVTLGVTEATAEGYTFSWAFGAMTFDPRPDAISAELFELIQGVERVDENVRVQIRTDRSAKPLEVLDAAAVYAERARALDALVDSLSQRMTREEAGGVVGSSRHATVEDLGTYWIGTLFPFHGSLCLRVPAAGKKSVGTTSAGETVSVELRVAAVDREAGTATVTQERRMSTGDGELLTSEVRLDSVWPVAVRSEQRQADTGTNVVVWERVP